MKPIEDPVEGCHVLWDALGDLLQAVEAANLRDENGRMMVTCQRAEEALARTLPLAPSDEQTEPF